MSNGDRTTSRNSTGYESSVSYLSVSLSSSTKISGYTHPTVVDIVATRVGALEGTEDEASVLENWQSRDITAGHQLV